MSFEASASHQLRTAPATAPPVAGPGTTCVLVVLIHEYQTLWKLLAQIADAAAVPSVAPGSSTQLLHAVTPNWSAMFTAYLSRLPHYYYAPLRATLQRFGLHNLVVPERNSSGYNRNVR